jgi:hypothetical protein
MRGCVLWTWRVSYDGELYLGEREMLLQEEVNGGEKRIIGDALVIVGK